VSRRGHFASLHKLVSFKVEHMICFTVSSIMKENTINRPRLKLIQILALLKNESFATENVEVTHIGSATMHKLIVALFLERS
jgi:hypothetical protein